MKRYDSYTDSGIDWIGEIPSHWEVKPLLRVLRKRITDGPHETPEIQSDGIPFISIESLNDSDSIDLLQCQKFISEEDFSRYSIKTQIEPNDILFSKSATIGKTAIVRDENFMIWSPLALIKVNFSCANIKFIYHVLSNNRFIESVILNGSFNTQANVGMRELEKSKIMVPPLDEQEAIADYLDRKCASIDGIIATQERRIALLNELKQSVITEAVTRGINHNAPLRDSGIDWIGQIPEHWEVKSIKSEGSFCKGLTFTKADLVDDGIAVISYGQIHSKNNDSVKLKNELMRFIPIELTLNQSKAKVKAGDFIFADTSEDLEGCGNHILIEDRKYDIYGGYHTIIFHRKKSDQNGKYLAYLFRTDNWRGQLRSRVAGVKVFSITQQILSSTSIILPPKEEQIQIVEYLEKKCARIDSALAKAKREIELLKEYKQSVITEAVTGKIKIC